MADILHRVGIRARAADVYAAITEPSGLQGWWSQHSKIEAVVGSQAAVSFYNNAVTFLLDITDLQPDKHVGWAVAGGPPDWAGTTIEWSLGEQDGQTTVDFAHRGFADMGGNFPSVNYNWGWYLTSLKYFLEQSKGMPHTDADVM